MATQTIGYTDKVFLNENSSIADINKIKDVDMNEIKSVVNNNASETDTNTANISKLQTYSSSEVDTGKKWTDGKTIYRRSIEFSNIAQGTATTIETLSNVDKFFVNSGMSYCTDGTGIYTIPKVHLSNANNQLDVRYTISSGTVALGCGSGNTARSGILTVEYTKTS